MSILAGARMLASDMAPRYSRWTASTDTGSQTSNTWHAVVWDATPAEGAGTGVTLSGDGKTFTFGAGLWTPMFSFVGSSAPTTGWIASIATSTAFSTKLRETDSNKVATQGALFLSDEISSTGTATLVFGSYPNGAAGTFVFTGGTAPRLTLSWRPLV